MIRKLLLAGAAAMMLMAVQAVAYADAVTLVQGQSITYTYQSSQFAGSSTQATFTLQGNQLTINYTNTSTNGTSLNGVGFNPSGSLHVTNAQFTSGPNWQFTTYNGGPAVYGSSSVSAGHSGTVVLTLSSVPPSLTISESGVYLTNMPNGNNDIIGGSASAASGVPEPATMLLFGTGLAGLAAKFRKRRKVSKE